MNQPTVSEDKKIAASPYYGSIESYGGIGDLRDTGDQGFGLADLFVLLRRRWELVLAVIVIGTAIAATYGFTRPEIYSASAKLLIEPEHRVVDLESVVEGVGSDAIAIETQINLLKSRSFLERFVTHSMLGVPITGDVLSEIKKLKGDESVGKLIAPTMAAESKGNEVINPSLSTTVNRMASGLNIGQQGRSFIINLEYSSQDPNESANLANELAEFYIQDQADRLRQITGEASRFLELRVSELKDELLAAEEAVQAYRSENPEHLRNDVSMVSEQMTDLTSLLVRARADRKEKEARLAFIAGLEASGENMWSLTEVLSSPYMASLWEEEARLRRQETELGLELAGNHPKIQTLAAERRAVKTRISQETGRIIENTRNELNVLMERERSLERDLKTFSGAASDEAVDADRTQIRLRLLQGNADASRRIYEEFFLRLKQTREQEAMVQANTRLVAKAQIPMVPSNRTPMVYVLMGFVSSSAMGLALAYFRERTDRKLRSGKEVSGGLGVSFLGLTPFLSGKETQGRKIHDYLNAKPASLYAETIRSIHTRVQLSTEVEHPKVYLVTSSLPNEGKTTLSISLATLLALDGKKTVLVDLDLRHPSIAKTLEIENLYPADEYLAGSEVFKRDLVNTHKGSFSVVALKKPMENPGKALRSKRLCALIMALRDKYDCIIIDSAPSLGLSDSKVLLEHSDSVLFVVRWNETPFETVTDAIKEMKDCNCPLAGVVLTQVNIKKHLRYGYGGIDNYYGKNTGYYKN